MNKFIEGFKKGFRPIAVFAHNCNKKPGVKSFLAGLISILLGIFCGFLVMLILSPEHAGAGLWTLLSTGFSTPQLLGRAIYQATPMILSGLAIAFAFKLNLFNIGITGQVTIGAFSSICCGLAGANWFVCMLVGALTGAVAGFVPGFLKAKFNVNEVLSGIMLNWIIYYIIGLIGRLGLPGNFKDIATPSELRMIPEAARMPSLGIPNMEGVSIGLIIAIVIVAVVFIVLTKTTFGFELQMAGRNKEASKYAGVNQTKSTILALTISGALAGLCGYMLYAEPGTPTKFVWDSSANTLLADGFNGISVSLIAQNSPIGCIFSSLLLTLISAAQNSLKTVSDGAYNIHYTELIKNVVIYLAALSSFFIYLINKLNARNDNIPYFNRDKKIIENKEVK